MSALIAGRYEPLEVLGVGARGRVLRAWDHRHQLQVVLEELPAAAPAQLDLEPHPHLPLVRDDFFEGPQHYLLAVELAAANVSGSPMVDSSLHLDERGATPFDHHQSLRVAFDWSYDRLSDRERAVFRALATLEQAFSLDEAEQRCASVGIPVEEVLESLVALVDKSLVVAEEREGQLSYRLLPLLGEYGRSCGVENTGSFPKH